MALDCSEMLNFDPCDSRKRIKGLTVTRCIFFHILGVMKGSSKECFARFVQSHPLP